MSENDLIGIKRPKKIPAVALVNRNNTTHLLKLLTSFRCKTFLS